MQKLQCEILEISTFKEGTVKIRAADGIHVCKVLYNWDRVYDFLIGTMPIIVHDVDANGIWYITIGE